MIKTLTIAALSALMALPAMADDSYIAGGRDGGGYDRRADGFVEQMRSGWATANFAGSEDIARAVCATSGTVEVPLGSSAPQEIENADISVGIAQIDAVFQMEREGCSLQLLGTYPAQEYGLILFPPDGYNELDDFSDGARILVGELGSGSALFWHTLVAIENSEYGNQSNWSQSEPVYGPYVLASTMASVGSIDAVIMVTSPDAEIIQTLLSQGWKLGELDDRHIDDFPFRRGSLYARGEIEIDHPRRRRNVSQDAVVVRSYWIGNPTDIAADPSLLGRLASTIARIQ